MTARLLAVAMALTLSACASEPLRVEVAVPVPCSVHLPPPPAWATESLPPDAGIFDQVKALLAERSQRIGYEAELEAAARSCSAS